MDLSLIIACYNEEGVLEQSIKEIISILDNTVFTYEVIFVDDCSKDKTREIISTLCEKYKDKNFRSIFHSKNTGRGGAVTDGFRVAQGDVIGYVDVDLEVPARYIPSCVLAIKEGADVAVGLRIYKFNIFAIDRYLMSRGYNWLVRKLLGINLGDTESGFKFFNRKRILPILNEIQDKGWFWDTEVMVRSYIKKYAIVEIPCLFLRRRDKPSTVNKIFDSVNYFRNLWKFKKLLKIDKNKV